MGKSGKKEHNIHFCIALEPEFARGAETGYILKSLLVGNDYKPSAVIPASK